MSETARERARAIAEDICAALVDWCPQHAPCELASCECEEQARHFEHRIAEALASSAAAMREAAAALADCAVTDAVDAERDDREVLGREYDINDYAAGYSAGAIATARQLAESVRALPLPPESQP